MAYDLAATVVAAAITVVNEQQNDDDEKQPAAIPFTAEQVSQTHRKIPLSPYCLSDDLATATAVGVPIVLVAAVVTTAILVKNQDDSNDEQQPSAVDVAAKQVAQTHIPYLLSESRKTVLSFSYYVVAPRW